MIEREVTDIKQHLEEIFFRRDFRS